MIERKFTRSRRKFFLLVVSLLLLAIVAAVVLVFAFIGRSNGESKECRRRDYGSDSFVCVCDANFCDQVEKTGKIDDKELVYFLTSRDKHRLKRFSIQAEKENGAKNDLKLRLYPSKRFQTVLGFGGAFTDAVGYLLNSLNPNARQHLLESYFCHENGIRYSMARIPIASTDFSMRIYSYADIRDDFDMKNFALAIEDLELKIPHILTAQQMVAQDFRLVASPWSAPWWMKESGNMTGGGPMKGQLMNGDDRYYRAYAKYLRQFFDEYAKQNVGFWGMTLLNEPYRPIERQDFWQAMLLTPKVQRQFAYHLLSPEFKSNGEATKDLKILCFDGQRRNVSENAQLLYENATEASALDGVAFHWYSFDGYQHSLLNAHAISPNKILLASEASCGDNHKNGEVNGPQLGNWTRGWMYGHDILNDLSNYANGWIDWNICLDLNGGPGWFGNTIDSPIIVNASAQEFYKQPMFYFMAHFSRFIPQNSVRISSTLFNPDGSERNTVDGFFLKDSGLLEQIAFDTADGNLAIVIMNGDATNEFAVQIEHGDKNWRLTLPPDSIATAIFKK